MATEQDVEKTLGKVVRQKDTKHKSTPLMVLPQQGRKQENHNWGPAWNPSRTVFCGLLGIPDNQKYNGGGRWGDMSYLVFIALSWSSSQPKDKS